MRTETTLAVAALVVLVGVVASIGLVADSTAAQQEVRGEPNFSVHVPEPVVAPGSATTVELDVMNAGEMRFGLEDDPRVTTARNVTISANATDSPLTVTSGESAYGELPSGTVTTYPVSLEVPKDIEPGEHEVTVTIDHTFNERAGGTQVRERDRSTVRNVSVTVREGPRFAIVDTDSETEVGGSGTLAVTMENVGEETATAASVTTTSPNNAVTLGPDGTGGESHVGEWAPGEQRTFSVDATIADSFAGGVYGIESIVTYADERGIDRESPVHRTGVDPAAERFSVVDADTSAEVGGAGTVDVTLRNDGGERLSDASVTLSAPSQSVTIGEAGEAVAVGDWARGETRTVSVDTTVADRFAADRFQVDAVVDYRDADGNLGESSRYSAAVEPDSRLFSVIRANTDAQVGGSGPVDLFVQYRGDEPIDDAEVDVVSSSEDVTIGETGVSSAYVGSWEPSETQQVTVESTVSGLFAGEQYGVDATVSYEDDRSITRTAVTRKTGVEPIPEQSFAIGDVTGTLEVGYSGQITATIENEGPIAVDDAVLSLEPATERIYVDESRYALPDLEPGESAEVNFDADVSGQAAPGTRQLRFTTEFTSGDATIATETTDRIEVAPRQPEFALEVGNLSVPAGETERFTVEITNARPERLSSINAGLYADSPITVIDDSGFSAGLDPDESTELVFEIAVDRSASPQTYPIEFDFRYDDERGNDRISDVMQEPVEVTEPVESDDGYLPLLIVGVLLVLVVAGGVYWLRYRDR